MAWGFGTAQPKPEPRKKAKARKLRLHRTHVHDVHDYVFMRERNICRCCRTREAHSMHELLFRSLGGKVSRKNSIAVCGSGTTLCHGFLQRNEIAWAFNDESQGAEAEVMFGAKTEAAATHMRIKLMHCIWSAPMRELEAAE